jgi:type VI secretion system secreted protein Hcp
MAVADYYLKIDGIDGESQDEEHKKEIELLSWSWGATNSGSQAYGGGGGTGKVSAQDFHFTKKHDTSSPKLMEACCSGQHFTKATVVARKAGKGQKEYMKWVFDDVVISSYQTGGSGGGDPIPTDSISFNFGKIEMNAKEQDATGTMKGAIVGKYSLKENKVG